MTSQKLTLDRQYITHTAAWTDRQWTDQAREIARKLNVSFAPENFGLIMRQQVHERITEMCFMLHGFILTRTIQEQKVMYPTDWWQAFKARWFPAWARRRWPVAFNEHHWKVVEAFPQLADKTGARSVVMVLDDGTAKRWQPENHE